VALRKRTGKDYAVYFAPAMVLTLAGFLIAYQFVAPAPPRRITIATGQTSGMYYRLGHQYGAIFARDRVTLTVAETSGSVENLRRLTSPGGGVDVIFLQGGVGDGFEAADLVSLGSVYYEPLWVFHRSVLPIRLLSDLRGRRIAAGPEGSGTRHLALRLLAMNGVSPENTPVLELGGAEALERLRSGEVDAVFSVVAYPPETLRDLLSWPEITLFSFTRGEAYVRRLPYLSLLELPRGTVDFVQDLPRSDVALLAPTAQLVAKETFHPALVDLLLQAARVVGPPGGLFEGTGRFPGPRFLDFPLSSEAERFYRSGPPFLRRYLPFWLANFLIRMKIMLLPLVALLIPLVKLLPPFYRWRVRRRIFRWYDLLEEIDYEMIHGGDACERRGAFFDRLAWIEQRLSETSVPLAYSRELYDMRIHIEMLRKKLIDAGAGVCDDGSEANRPG
jgi:TRAP transporter TAXI family solute receptor